MHHNYANRAASFFFYFILRIITSCRYIQQHSVILLTIYRNLEEHTSSGVNEHLDSHPDRLVRQFRRNLRRLSVPALCFLLYFMLSCCLYLVFCVSHLKMLRNVNKVD